MSFLNKLFGVNESKDKQSILDFFEIDLTTLPDDTFVKSEDEKDEKGNIVEKYIKSLNYKECNIFDTVDVLLHPNTNSKNVTLKSYEPENVNMNYLKKLINEIYQLYGSDSMDNLGKFTNEDIRKYNSDDFYMLFGRFWTDEKYEFPVHIGRNENEVYIHIWDIT